MWAAGTVTQSIAKISKGRYKVTFLCVGDAAGGTPGVVPATATTDYGTKEMAVGLRKTAWIHPEFMALQDPIFMIIVYVCHA